MNDLVKFLKDKRNISYFFLLVTMVLGLTRAFFSAELSDEAYAIAEPYLVMSGGVPFVSNWTQIPGFSLFLVPFVYLFVGITGGTEGIFLYMRIIALVLSVFFVVIDGILIDRYVLNNTHDHMGYIILSPFILPYYYGIVAFRADRLALFFILTSSILMYIALYSEKVDSLLKVKMLLFLAGSIAAFGILCYVTLAVYCVITLVAVLLTSCKRKKFAVYYIFGGLFIAFAVTSFLVAFSGAEALMKGLGFLIKDNLYSQMENAISGGFWKYFGNFIKDLVFNFIILRGIILFILIYLLLSFMNYSKSDREMDSVLLCIPIALVSYIVTDIDMNNMTLTHHIMMYAFLMCPILLVTIKSKVAYSLFLIIWPGTLGWFLVTSLVTHCIPEGRCYLLSNGTMLFLILIFLLDRDRNSEHFTILRMPYIIPIIIVIGFAINIFNFIYRDADIRSLDTRVSEGVYRGVYTTSERNKALRETEKIVREHTDEDDYILVMESQPYVYLMSDATPCTPSTWDMSLYSDGYNNPEIYYDYFEMVGRIPTKILYVDNGRNKYFSIDTDGYLFNNFIKEKYELTYENRSAGFPILIYGLKGEIE